MKIKLLYISFILFPFSAFAQNTTIKETMPTITVPIDYNNDTFREALVLEAAKNVSITRDALNQAEIAKYEVGISKSQWLNYITVSGNLNEFTLNTEKYGDRSVFFPRYNFGLSFQLGSFVKNANNVKIAKANLQIAQDKQKMAPIILRSHVLSKFEEYIQAKEVLKMQAAILNDEETVYALNERKFKSNEISLEQFNNSSKGLFAEKTKTFELQKNLAIIKYELEAIVGAIVIDNQQ